MHTIKLLLTYYLNISVQAANLSDCRIESKKIDSVARIESNKNIFCPNWNARRVTRVSQQELGRNTTTPTRRSAMSSSSDSAWLHRGTHSPGPTSGHFPPPPPGTCALPRKTYKGGTSVPRITVSTVIGLGFRVMARI